MTTNILRRAFAAIAFAILLAGAPAVDAQTPAAQPAPAAQPGRPAAADEQALMNYLRGDVAGRVSIPDQRSAQLIQLGGPEWRMFHQTTLKWIGIIAILGIALALLVFYLVRGKIRIEGGPSGRLITRFGGIERFAHWLTAGSFVVLALTGLNLLYGRQLLLPVLGPEAFAGLSQWGKYFHNFLSFPFVLGLILMFVLWVKDNIPKAIDVQWFAAGGGLIGDGHPPSEKFNGGQKIIFWLVVLGGGALAVTGFALMFPFAFLASDVEGMQVVQIVHAIISVLMIAVILAHIYIGSVGMEGAFDAMGTGQVDANWARAHHNLWYDRVHGKGRAPAE